MASLNPFKGWWLNLTPQTKKLILGTTALTVAGLIFIRRKSKKAKQKDVDDEISEEIEANQANRSKILLPISTNPTFWCSYLLTASTFGLTFSDKFSSLCNAYIPRLMSHRFSKSFTDLLPPVPSSFSEAYKLGQLQLKLTQLEQSGATKQEIKNLLLSATKLLNRHLDEMVTSKQLHGVLDHILSIENKQSMISRIRGIFSFVNVIWFFSILGISVTVIPFVYLIGKPIWDEIYNFFKLWLNRIGRILYKIMFNPTAYKVYEVCGYFMCWYFMYLGYEGKTNIGFWTAFTGLALWAPMQWISAALHDGFGRSRMSEKEVMPMMCLLSGLLSLPMAYHYNSKLLGFLTIGGLYSYLGFFIHGFFGGYIVGFQGDESVKNCVTASCIFNALIIGSKIQNVDLYPFRMFISPTLTVSNTVLFLALLCHTSEWRYWRHSVDYWQRNGLMIGGLAAAMAAGNILNYPALANTGYVYSGLYILQKMAENDALWRSKNAIYTIFASSIIGWRVALYLNKNPQIVTGMFKLE